MSYNLEYLSLGDPYMKRITEAVIKAVPEMEIGKKYTLKQMVKLGESGVWLNKAGYINKCAGRTFKCWVSENIPDLICVSEYRQYTLRYMKKR